ncbi:hypothetical protein [Seleniivibrio sp.]|uniref:hypothetical protein n=1 Tax=Seleniivibrio sp. TaxID=2898801 RepID=UPI0025E7243D|nr:hypothetical protein [Seleniivibrio sp.]MCD8552296.1 hypothetical protein [Seleniivibrio sp.]
MAKLTFIFAILCLLIGLIFPPFIMIAIIMLLIALFLKPTNQKPDNGFLAGLKRGLYERKCPYCLSQIPADALKCKHCGEFVKPD